VLSRQWEQAAARFASAATVDQQALGGYKVLEEKQR
jgi:hypothetical protein